MSDTVTRSKSHTELKKYWTLLNLSWQNGLVYRATLLIWRARQLLSTMMSLTVWTVIFSGRSTAFDYSPNQMISYIFLISILQSLIFASSLHGLAGEVYAGQISQYLLKPQKIFLTFATLEIADKARNVVFSLGEGILLFFLFHPILVSPDIQIWLTFLIWALLGTIINFFITILFGCLGFWSPDTWGPKFLFFMIVDFTAGKLYPLDILPKAVQNFLWLTPFPYLSYVQIQLFLNRLSLQQYWTVWIGIVMWTIALGWLTQKLWRKGTHDYEASGL